MKHNHKSQDALGITNNRCIAVRKSMYLLFPMYTIIPMYVLVCSSWVFLCHMTNSYERRFPLSTSFHAVGCGGGRVSSARARMMLIRAEMRVIR